MRKHFLFLCSCFLCFFSCNEKKEDRTIERAFYFWRSNFDLNQTEQNALQQQQVKTLYIKYFDVDWDNARQEPVPIARLTSSQPTLPAGTNIIPTVFITNSCILHLKPAAAAALAQKISRLIDDLSAQHNFQNIPEVQIDCDWTAATKDAYFSLLKSIKPLQKKTLSATIRLHQVKYVTGSGIPPADRGMLMCYNMGNLKNPATKNSIIDITELNKYIGALSAYPLDLDLAFPLFEWKVLFRNNAYKGLVQYLPTGILNKSFTVHNGNRYTLMQDTVLNGYEFKKGDVLRDEQSDYETVFSSAKTVGKKLRNTRLRVSLYQLDSVLLKKYTSHELETIYNSLR
jgi:hypothetical protein